MTERTILLSRIEQIMRLGKKKEPTVADYLSQFDMDRLIDTKNPANNDYRREFVNSFFKHLPIDRRPMLLLGRSGPQVLAYINTDSSLAKRHAPVMIRYEAAMERQLPLVSVKLFNDKFKDMSQVAANLQPFSETKANNVNKEAFINKWATRLISDLKAGEFAPDKFIGHGLDEQELANLPTKVKLVPGNKKGKAVRIPKEEREHRHLLPKVDKPLGSGKQPLTKYHPRGASVHNQKLWRAIHRALQTPEDIKKLSMEVVNATPSNQKFYSPYIDPETGQLKDRVPKDVDQQFHQDMRDLIEKKGQEFHDRYIISPEYVDDDGTVHPAHPEYNGKKGDKSNAGEWSKKTPADVKRAYSQAEGEITGHLETYKEDEKLKEDATIDSGEEPPVTPWYEQLGVKVQREGQVKNATGIWTDSKGKKYRLKGDEVYHHPKIGDIIVRNLNGMRTRIFAPGINRTFVNSKGIQDIIRMYFERNLPIPKDYKPYLIGYEDWKQLAVLREEIYQDDLKKAKTEKQRQKLTTAYEDWKKKFRGVSLKAREEDSKEWGNQDLESQLLRDNTDPKFDIKLREFQDLQHEGNSNEIQRKDFYDGFTPAQKDFFDQFKKNLTTKIKALKQKFDAEQDLNIPNPMDINFSPLDAGEARLPYMSNKDRLQSDSDREYQALKDKAAESIKNTPAFQEFHKWSALHGELASKGYKHVALDDAAEAAYDKALLDRTEAEEKAAEKKQKNRYKKYKEADENKKGAIGTTESSQGKSNPTLTKFEKRQLEWLKAKKDIARTAVKLEYHKAFAKILQEASPTKERRISHVDNLLSDDGTYTYDATVDSDGQITDIRNKKQLKPNQIKAFKEANSPSMYKRYNPASAAAYDKAYADRMKSMQTKDIKDIKSDRAKKVGIEPLSDNPDRGFGDPSPHRDWQDRLDRAITEAIKIGTETKDWTELNRLYDAFPNEKMHYRNTQDPRSKRSGAYAKRANLAFDKKKQEEAAANAAKAAANVPPPPPPKDKTAERDSAIRWEIERAKETSNASAKEFALEASQKGIRDPKEKQKYIDDGMDQAFNRELMYIGKKFGVIITPSAPIKTKPEKPIKSPEGKRREKDPTRPWVEENKNKVTYKIEELPQTVKEQTKVKDKARINAGIKHLEDKTKKLTAKKVEAPVPEEEVPEKPKTWQERLATIKAERASSAPASTHVETKKKETTSEVGVTKQPKTWQERLATIKAERATATPPIPKAEKGLTWQERLANIKAERAKSTSKQTWQDKLSTIGN